MRNVLWSPVSVSVHGRMPTLLHGPGRNLGNGRVCPLVVHYWAYLQPVHKREMSASACTRSMPGWNIVAFSNTLTNGIQKL